MLIKNANKIIAVDLDATLATYEGWEKHGKESGPPRPDVVNGVRRLKNAGYIIGLFTCRNTEKAKEWVKKYNLEDLIDFVNDNPDQPSNGSHKTVAHCYIDDRAIRYDGTNMEEICDKILAGKMDPWYKKIDAKEVYFIPMDSFSGDPLKICFLKEDAFCCRDKEGEIVEFVRSYDYVGKHVKTYRSFRDNDGEIVFIEEKE